MNSQFLTNTAAKQWGRQLRTSMLRQISTMLPYLNKSAHKSSKVSHQYYNIPHLTLNTPRIAAQQQHSCLQQNKFKNPIATQSSAPFSTVNSSHTAASSASTPLPTAGGGSKPNETLDLQFNQNAFKQSHHLQGSIPHLEYGPQPLTKKTAASPFTSITFISLLTFFPLTVFGMLHYSNPVYTTLLLQKAKRWIFFPKYFEQYMFFDSNSDSSDTFGYISLECDLRDTAQLPVNILHAQRIVLREVGKVYKNLTLINQLRTQFETIMEIPSFKNDRRFHAQVQTMKSNRAELEDILQGIAVGFVKPTIQIENSCLINANEFEKKYTKPFAELLDSQLKVQFSDGLKLVALNNDKAAREAAAKHTGMHRENRHSKLKDQNIKNDAKSKHINSISNANTTTTSQNGVLSHNDIIFQDDANNFDTTSIADVIPVSLSDLLDGPSLTSTATKYTTSNNPNISETMQTSEYTTHLKLPKTQSSMIHTSYDPLKTLSPLQSMRPELSEQAKMNLTLDEQELLSRTTFGTNLRQAELEALADRRYRHELRIIEMQEPGFISRRLLSPMLEILPSPDDYSIDEKRIAYFFYLQQQASNMIITAQFLELVVSELREQINNILTKKKLYHIQEQEKQLHVSALAKNIKNDTLWSDNSGQSSEILNPHAQNISPFDFVFEVHKFSKLADKSAFAPITQLNQSGEKSFWNFASNPQYQFDRPHLLKILQEHPSFEDDLIEQFGISRLDLINLPLSHQIGRIVSTPPHYASTQNDWYTSHPFNTFSSRRKIEHNIASLNPKATFEEISIAHRLRAEFRKLNDEIALSQKESQDNAIIFTTLQDGTTSIEGKQQLSEMEIQRQKEYNEHKLQHQNNAPIQEEKEDEDQQRQQNSV